MPTLLEISNNLAKKFVRSKNKRYAAKCIADQINCLRYCNTKQPVDYSVKIAMVQVIYELIAGTRPVQLSYGEMIFIKPKDISDFSKLNNEILKMLHANNEQKDREIQTAFKRPEAALQIFTLNFYNVNNYMSELGKYFKIKKQQ